MARKSSKNLLFTGMNIPKELQNVMDQKWKEKPERKHHRRI